MNSLFGCIALLSLLACAYFLVRLIIAFIKKRDKKYYIKRIAATFALFIVGFIGFGMTQTPEQKAKYEAIRLTQEKEKEQKKAIEKAEADKKAKEEADRKAKEEADKKAVEKVESEKKAIARQEAAEVDSTKQQPNTTVSPENKIKDKIKDYINDYNDTTIDSITINQNLGTDKDGDYIALVRLTWNVKNRGKRSKEMLDMYSSDMAAKMYEDLPEVQELAVFWTVPYLNGSAKISFERVNGGMKYADKMFDKNFND